MKPHFLVLLLLATVFTATVASSEEVTKKAKREAKHSIELTVDYGDGAQKRFPQVPWMEKMTVFDALMWAGKHSHGIQIKHRGKDSLALVSQIDDLKNSGSGKNWIFYINQKLSERGCGASKVRFGDKILWRYEEYR